MLVSLEMPSCDVLAPWFGEKYQKLYYIEGFSALRS